MINLPDNDTVLVDLYTDFRTALNEHHEIGEEADEATVAAAGDKVEVLLEQIRAGPPPRSFAAVRALARAAQELYRDGRAEIPEADYTSRLMVYLTWFLGSYEG